jgi:hypothetical protein
MAGWFGRYNKPEALLDFVTRLGQTPPKKILFVDDNSDNVFNMFHFFASRQLEQLAAGYRHDTTRHTKNALICGGWVMMWGAGVRWRRRRASSAVGFPRPRAAKPNRTIPTSSPFFAAWPPCECCTKPKPLLRVFATL